MESSLLILSLSPKKEMDENTIRSAINIITEKSKEDKIETLEAKIGTMEELLRQMNDKLDKLM